MSINKENGKANDTIELEKAKEYITVEIVEYVPNAIMSRTIIKKSTGNVVAISVSEGEELTEKIIPFDTFVQIIDGAAVVTISKKTFDLKLGSGIVIPAHASHFFTAKEKFKMICTVIKSGYED